MTCQGFPKLVARYLPITADVLYVRKCVICTYVNVCMRRLSYMYVCIHVNMGYSV